MQIYLHILLEYFLLVIRSFTELRFKKSNSKIQFNSQIIATIFTDSLLFREENYTKCFKAFNSIFNSNRPQLYFGTDKSIYNYYSKNCLRKFMRMCVRAQVSVRICVHIYACVCVEFNDSLRYRHIQPSLTRFNQ